jgi:simple sugar transport system permease protein
VNSGAAIQVMGVPSQIVTMIQGSMMIFVIAGEYFNNYKVRIVRSEKNLLISDQLEDNA